MSDPQRPGDGARDEPAEVPEVPEVLPAGDQGGEAGALGALLGGGGLDGLLEQAQQMMEAQAEAADTIVEGVAGGGVVRIRVTGGGKVDSVSISPEVVDPDVVAMLEDLVVAALRDVNERLGALQREAMGGLGDLLGGGGFDDLLGGR